MNYNIKQQNRNKIKQNNKKYLKNKEREKAYIK